MIVALLRSLHRLAHGRRRQRPGQPGAHLRAERDRLWQVYLREQSTNTRDAWAVLGHVVDPQRTVHATPSWTAILVDVERERREADARAEALLREHLTDRQIADLDHRGFFEVRGSAGHKFRVHRRDAFNVVTPDGVALCAEPDVPYRAGDVPYLLHHLPVPDIMLAQKLMLETDEPGFMAVANRGTYDDRYHDYHPWTAP